MSEVALPTSFDWRDQAGVSYLGGVAAQGECGSCVSFAAVSTLEAQLNIACGTPDRAFALSRQYFFSCGGGNCSSGWKISDAVAYLEDHGVPDEACLPYAAGEGTDVACDSACDDATNRRVRGVDIERPTVGYVDVPAIKQALLRGPLLANMILFEDLEFYAGGVYRQTTGRQLGSHAIVLVGWNDAEQAWIARNSWGEGWGEQGYFRIAWDDRTLPGRYTWAFDVDAAKAAGVCSQPR
jgi:C1A family cysteine protease